MSSIVLEAIVLGAAQELTLPLVAHVHKRLERFVYREHIRNHAVPIVFLENAGLDSRKNLQIANRTYTIPLNAPRNLHLRHGWTEVQSTSYTSPYRDVLITNQVTLNSRGQTIPLFWRHRLPDSTIEATLYSVEDGNRITVDSGFLKDLDGGNLYTNYKNFVDLDTGNYKLYYVVSTDEAGTTTSQLLNPVPVVEEATWEDIDLGTGEIKDGHVVFSRDQSASGWTFTFSVADVYYVKTISTALVQPIIPSGKTGTDSWHLKFTHGDFSALVNGEVRRYWMPEYDVQPFFPFKPIIYSPNQTLVWVNSRVASFTRDSLAILPSSGRHVTVQVFDDEAVLIKVYTTDQSLGGTRYRATGIFYEADKIQSWDNSSGLISFGIDILPSWQLMASYFYEANDLEYRGLDLNPIRNPKAFDQMYVFYMIPNVDEEDRAIHYLVLDRSGVILYTSQSVGISYSNLQLTEDNGDYNPNTVIGLKYISEEDTGTFTDLYCVGDDNRNAYAVLAEAVVVESDLIEDMVHIMVDQPGNVIKEANFLEAIRANPRILQSRLGYGENGEEIPRNAVMLARLPLNILEEWGGELTEDQAVELLRRYQNSATSTVVEWDYPVTVLTGSSTVVAEADLSWTWEGPTQIYNLYRADGVGAPWQLVYTLTNPIEGALGYTDTGLTSGSSYLYGVRIVENSIEYPMGNTLIVSIS